MSTKNSTKAKAARREIGNEVDSIEWAKYWKTLEGKK